MATLLMGHGEAISSEQVTVPAGLTISFLIDEARIMPFSSAVGVVLHADALASEGFKFTSTHEAGDVISNHRLVSLDSRQRAWYAQVDPEDGSCFYAGEHFDSGLRLCNDPGPDSQCMQGGFEVHTCGGLFSFTWPDTHLVWVSCRQGRDVPGVSMPQATVGGQPSESFDLAAKVRGKLKSDPEGFADYFGKLSAEEQAIALTLADVRNWSHCREARNWLYQPTTTALDFYRFVAGQSEAEQSAYLREPDLKAAYERGEYVHNAYRFLEEGGPTTFLQYVRRLDAAALELLRTDPRMADIIDRASDDHGGELGAAHDLGITFDGVDWNHVQRVNQLTLKEAAKDASLPYWQDSGRLLLGSSFPARYRIIFERRRGVAGATGDAPNGYVKVISRPGTFSSGEITVSGECDADSFRASIGGFFKGKVRFD